MKRRKRERERERERDRERVGVNIRRAVVDKLHITMACQQWDPRKTRPVAGALKRLFVF